MVIAGIHALKVAPLLLLVWMLAGVPAAAQLVIEEGRGLVGQEVQLPIRYGPLQGNGNDTLTLEGTLKLGNPTVFFPERFVPPVGAEVTDWMLERIDGDSVYTFSVTVETSGANAGDTLCYLAGEALAGSDSICTIAILSPTLNLTAVGDADGRIITRSIGTPLPYVRYATLERGYPDPILRGGTVTFGYRIDKDSPVRFTIYTVNGEEIDGIDLGMMPKGVHIFRYTTFREISVGFYLIRMQTNTNDVFQSMHIVR